MDELKVAPASSSQVWRPLFTAEEKELCSTVLVAQTVRSLPAVQETRVPSLGREDPLEEGMTTHSSILAWEIPWTEEPGGLQSTGSQRVRRN